MRAQVLAFGKGAPTVIATIGEYLRGAQWGVSREVGNYRTSDPRARTAKTGDDQSPRRLPRWRGVSVPAHAIVSVLSLPQRAKCYQEFDLAK